MQAAHVKGALSIAAAALVVVPSKRELNFPAPSSNNPVGEPTETKTNEIIDARVTLHRLSLSRTAPRGSGYRSPLRFARVPNTFNSEDVRVFADARSELNSYIKDSRSGYAVRMFEDSSDPMRKLAAVHLLSEEHNLSKRSWQILFFSYGQREDPLLANAARNGLLSNIVEARANAEILKRSRNPQIADGARRFLQARN